MILAMAKFYFWVTSTDENISKLFFTPGRFAPLHEASEQDPGMQSTRFTY